MLSFALFLFPFLMVFAACMDLFTMRISNRLNIAIALAFLPVAALADLPFLSLSLQSVVVHYACGLAMLLLGFVIFAFGKIGGGDAKFLAASAVWIGWENLLDYLLATSVVGGVLALCLVGLRKCPLPAALLKQPWLVTLHEPDGQVPYGVALGAGAVFAYAQTPVWLAATGS